MDIATLTEFFKCCSIINFSKRLSLGFVIENLNSKNNYHCDSNIFVRDSLNSPFDIPPFISPKIENGSPMIVKS